MVLGGKRRGVKNKLKKKGKRQEEKERLGKTGRTKESDL
jgi:hypothetical protein